MHNTSKHGGWQNLMKPLRTAILKGIQVAPIKSRWTKFTMTGSWVGEVELLNVETL
jgi:hypothetical protein